MWHSLLLISQVNQGQVAQAPPPALIIVVLVLAVLIIAGLWACFTKAGEPGWAAIVPFYNVVVMLKIAGKPLWWILLMLIPIVSLIMSVVVAVEFGKAYGKGLGFGLGLAFLPFIFYPLLGFGDAEHEGSLPNFTAPKRTPSPFVDL